MWLACVQCCTGAREQVCLPCGWRVCSAEWAQLNGCACYVANSLKSKKGVDMSGNPPLSSHNMESQLAAPV